MLETWARAYADRWGLPDPALHELQSVLDAAGRGDVASQGAATRLDLPTDPPSSPPDLPEELERVALGDFGDRYEDLGPIGEGGMGEVRRVWDAALHRAVAMKVLRRDLASREDLVLRFVEEAQATAQLEHPGIMPVYDVGRLPDGRPFFTMKEIRGRSLLEVIEDVHAASDDGWQPSPSGWTFQRLIGVLQSVCEAVAYAHSRGVLHRDLKPTNVMVGAFGEVVVMDWGLAKVRAEAGVPATPARRDGGQVVTARSRGNLYMTRSGSVAGTPNYMPPEQARGESGRVGPWSDVYALGALLYEILADRAPYDGEDLDEVVAKVLAGPPPPPVPRWWTPDGNEPPAEEGLRAICERAMAREIADRYMDAGTLAEVVSDWLATAGARDRAMALVRSADQLEPELVAYRKQIATLRAAAAQALAALPPHAPPQKKREAWSMEDEADALEQEMQRKQARYVDLLQAALAGAPDLPEATTRLEALGDLTGERWLRGEPAEGWLTLLVHPPGARVQLQRFERSDRRLVPAPVAEHPRPMAAPLDRLSLPSGSWRLRIEADGHEALTVLARVRPGEPWTTTPPGTNRPLPVRLARVGEDPPETVRIPAGWFWSGGDRETDDSLPRSKAWTQAFLMRRHPVTCAEYFAFLDQLEGGGRDAARLAPAGATRSARGWALPAGWEPDEPVRAVTFDAASTYAAWLAATTGRPWRLPREREWEKAARGSDERLYPWGDHLDPAWCCIADSHSGAPQPASIHAFPLDESPYGVRGLAGNVRDWVVDDRASRTGAVPTHWQLVKGGHWLGPAQLARCALRYRPPRPADETIGFRLVCPLEP